MSRNPWVCRECKRLNPPSRSMCKCGAIPLVRATKARIEAGKRKRRFQAVYRDMTDSF